MRLYSGSSEQFIEDTTRNAIANKLKESFFQHFRYNPSDGEVRSWTNSLRSMALLLDRSGLNDNGVLLEYQLPLTSKRLDCMVCGIDAAKEDRSVIIELKQWDACDMAEGDNEVSTYVGHAIREVLHPSVQVGQYATYLMDTHTAFYEDDHIGLDACAYLHNYHFDPEDTIFNEKFSRALDSYPVFTADDYDSLSDYLIRRLGKGDGLRVLKRVEESKYRPSKKLMDHVGGVIKGKSEYTLLDEQLVAYDKVLSRARRGFHGAKKTVIIIKGGPGTGKSVIAINLMADLLLKGYNAHYATGSKAFTETLRKIIGSRGSVQFKYFNSYVHAEPNSVDVMIADEAHRIRETSNSRFTKKTLRSNVPQVDEMIRASKVLVCLIDDDQTVRPNEIGSSDYIRKMAFSKGCEVIEYELEAQFRCAGSEAFVNWVNNTLGIKRTADVIWDQGENFDFRIFSDPNEMENAIRGRVFEGHTGRMVAGFCWPWSNLNGDGRLVDDVVIGEYSKPWNAKPNTKGLAKSIPRSDLWAHDPNGIDQIGCVYTAQGFEFDYVGVIFGRDLRYDLDEQRWVGHPEESYDNVVKRSKDQFTELVKNTYRVLLSRGMKGCYVHFMDQDTERFFKSRME